MKRRVEADVARKRNNATLPTNIRDLLRNLIDEDVVIVLKSGKCEEVEVLGVERNMLIADFNGKIKFVDIDCICEVLADPEDIIEGLFQNHCGCD